MEYGGRKKLFADSPFPLCWQAWSGGEKRVLDLYDKPSDRNVM